MRLADLHYWDQGAFKVAMEAGVDEDSDLEIQVCIRCIVQKPYQNDDGLHTAKLNSGRVLLVISFQTWGLGA